MNAVALDRRWYLPPLHPAVEKLEHFAEFDNGWAFGEGKAFQPEILHAAEKILLQALGVGYSDCDVFPGREGQIVVTVYAGNESFDFTVFGGIEIRVSLTHEVDGEEVALQDGHDRIFSVDDVLLCLRGYERWLSSASSTHTNTNTGSIVLKALPSSHQVTVLGSQYSTSIARLIDPEHRVPTPSVTIKA